MHIHTAAKTKKRSKIRQRRFRRLTIALLVVGYGGWVFTRPLATIAAADPNLSLYSAPQSSLLRWPASQAAVGIVGAPILDTHGAPNPVPTASVAKVITALSVLQKNPLALGQTGPIITLGQVDVNFYNQYVSEDGSVVPVTVDEQITEYQVLEAMMLPSANNMADSLALWAFGSLNNYAVYANGFVQKLGMANTHIGSDASGFDPSTTSTASDLVKLGEAAMANPVLAQIVNERSAHDIPNVDVIKNVNFLLGQNGIIGIKTGNTDQAGGAFIAASQSTANGQNYIIVTAVIGANNLYDALSSSNLLITSAQKNFSSITVVTQGTIIGRYTTPWGSTVSAIAQQTINSFSWRGSTVSAQAKLNTISGGAKKGQIVGIITVPATQTSPAQSSAITLQGDITKPSLWWRVTHPLS